MREFLQNSVFFGALITIAAYILGLALKRRFKLAILNPLLIAVLCVIGVNALAGVSYESYASGTKIISYLLTPATICLAVPLYEQLTLLKKRWRAVAAGVVAGVLGSLLCVLLFSLLFGFSNELYVTLLPKSITSAIGMGVSAELGGIVPLTVASIILTGILGSIICAPIFKLFGVREPLARGLALGVSSHAMGSTKALELGAVEGAASSLAIVVAGVLTVICAPLFAGFI